MIQQLATAMLSIVALASVGCQHPSTGPSVNPVASLPSERVYVQADLEQDTVSPQAAPSAAHPSATGQFPLVASDEMGWLLFEQHRDGPESIELVD